MGVTSAEASLRAWSDDNSTTPADVTSLLGVIPSETVLKGHRRGRVTDQHHMWFIHSNEVVAPDEQAIDLAIAKVLGPLDDKDEQLRHLHHSWKWDIIVSADSDSSQGGFVIAPETLLRAGQVHAHLLCTVYASDLG